jgi:hypothetical protein
MKQVYFSALGPLLWTSPAFTSRFIPLIFLCHRLRRVNFIDNINVLFYKTLKVIWILQEKFLKFLCFYCELHCCSELPYWYINNAIAFSVGIPPIYNRKPGLHHFVASVQFLAVEFYFRYIGGSMRATTVSINGNRIARNYVHFQRLAQFYEATITCRLVQRNTFGNESSIWYFFLPMWHFVPYHLWWVLDYLQ